MPIRNIVIAGAGRMGNAIAIAFAYAGLAISIIDVKERDAQAKIDFKKEWEAEISKEIALLEKIKMIESDQASEILARVHFHFKNCDQLDLKKCELIIEGVPEVMNVKKDLFDWLDSLIQPECIVASTTSTFLVTDIAKLISKPERVVNAHWLNPAYLIPLVELSRSEQTSDQVVQSLKELLEEIGKVPVVCNAVAGYIVPRIQALAMNEAARMVEENVASAEDIDKAIRTGFGLRFSILGMLEFIDWGGGDILYHASNYLKNELGERYAPPQIITDNMQANRNGMRELEGFYEYRNIDIQAYKLRVIDQFAQHLRFKQLIPQYDVIK